MKIDFDHIRGEQLANEAHNNLILEGELSIIASLKPEFRREGDQWMYLYGEMPEHYIVGFGDTPYKAMLDFNASFYNAKAKPEILNGGE